MSKQKETTKTPVKKVTEKKTVKASADFNAKKESVLLRCEQANVIEAHLKEINNTTNEKELNDLLMNNIELRPFMED